MLPLLSVLFATRNRSEILEKTITSIREGWGQHMETEICVKIDNDDEASLQVLQKLSNLDLKVVISPRGRGYLDLPEYHNTLYGVATGTYILLWNDDAILDDAGDLKYRLEENIEVPSVISTTSNCNFPAVHSKILQWLEERYTGATPSGLFGDVLYFDGYINSICSSVPELRASRYSSYKYTHYGWDISPAAQQLIDEVGWEKGWQEVEDIKTYMRSTEHPRSGNSWSRIMSDSRYLKWKLSEYNYWRLEEGPKNIL